MNEVTGQKPCWPSEKVNEESAMGPTDVRIKKYVKWPVYDINRI